MAHSPAFQLNVSDFRQDPKTIRMTTAEIGAYFLLLMECWDKDNSLPADIEHLADVARLSLGRFKRMWDERIGRCFVLDTPSQTYSHKRLAKEIRKQSGWSRVMSDAGKKGAAKRWANKDLDSQAKQGHSHPIASDSSSSKKEEEFKHTHNAGATPQAVWTWPMKPLIDHFPIYLPPRITPAMIGFIEGEVKPGDEVPWDRTIETYSMNFNPALSRYLPDKTANLISVFRKEKAKFEQEKNGTNRQYRNGQGKRSDTDTIAVSADWYENEYPA